MMGTYAYKRFSAIHILEEINQKLSFCRKLNTFMKYHSFGINDRVDTTQGFQLCLTYNSRLENTTAGAETVQAVQAEIHIIQKLYLKLIKTSPLIVQELLNRRPIDLEILGTSSRSRCAKLFAQEFGILFHPQSPDIDSKD